MSIPLCDWVFASMTDSCILTALRFPVSANLIFFWATGKGSGVGGRVGEIVREKGILLYSPRPAMSPQLICGCTQDKRTGRIHTKC